MFSGPKYWYSIHKDGRPAEGFVRNVREITPQIRHVDAALYINEQHGAYIFSGQYYFKVEQFRTYQLKVCHFYLPIFSCIVKLTYYRILVSNQRRVVDVVSNLN